MSVVAALPKYTSLKFVLSKVADEIERDKKNSDISMSLGN
jgi:hypothetical protein